MESNWQKLKSAYGLPYDPREAIARLRDAPLSRGPWDELWNELHHQGDIGDAAYAAVPLIVEACEHGPRDWRCFALLAVIEVERHRKSNPPLPEWVATSYRDALRRTRALALADLSDTTDARLIRSALSVVALVSEAVEIGALLSHLDASEIRQVLDDQLAWGESYRAANT